jgi:hypothetical protein
MDTLQIDTLCINARHFDTLHISTLHISTGVDDIVVSSRAMHHATDSHWMPIPEPRARCTRHDRVVSGAPVAYMCADAIRVRCVKRTPSNSLLDVVGSGVAREKNHAGSPLTRRRELSLRRRRAQRVSRSMSRACWFCRNRKGHSHRRLPSTPVLLDKRRARGTPASRLGYTSDRALGRAAPPARRRRTSAGWQLRGAPAIARTRPPAAPPISCAGSAGPCWRAPARSTRARARRERLSSPAPRSGRRRPRRPRHDRG